MGFRCAHAAIVHKPCISRNSCAQIVGVKSSVAVAALTAAVWAASPAHATEEQYLHNLSGEQFYARLGAQTVLAEGYKVCAAHTQGLSDADIRQMIRTDLAVSTSAAIDLKVAAEMYLGC